MLPKILSKPIHAFHLTSYIRGASSGRWVKARRYGFLWDWSVEEILTSRYPISDARKSNPGSIHDAAPRRNVRSRAAAAIMRVYR